MTAHPDRELAVDRYLETVEPARRRRDGATLADLIEAVSGEPARLLGTILGCVERSYATLTAGTYTNRARDGQEASFP